MSGLHSSDSDSRMMVFTQASSASEVTSLLLLTRYHKRVAGHLANILSSVVFPVHQMDFMDDEADQPKGESGH